MAEYTGTFERKEVKYRLNPVQVRMVKQALGAYMAPDEYGQTSITSVYYDTRNRDMISRSLESPRIRKSSVCAPMAPEARRRRCLSS